MYGNLICRKRVNAAFLFLFCVMTDVDRARNGSTPQIHPLRKWYPIRPRGKRREKSCGERARVGRLLSRLRWERFLECQCTCVLCAFFVGLNVWTRGYELERNGGGAR